MSAYERQLILIWLVEQGLLDHLDVRTRGDHIIVFSEENEEKWDRIRLTRLGGGAYQLGMADHRGRWDQTPFTGTLQALLDLVASDFPWLLTDA